MDLLLVGNKCDRIKDRAVSLDLAKAFARNNDLRQIPSTSLGLKAIIYFMDYSVLLKPQLQILQMLRVLFQVLYPKYSTQLNRQLKVYFYQRFVLRRRNIHTFPFHQISSINHQQNLSQIEIRYTYNLQLFDPKEVG